MTSIPAICNFHISLLMFFQYFSALWWKLWLCYRRPKWSGIR